MKLKGYLVVVLVLSLVVGAMLGCGQPQSVATPAPSPTLKPTPTSTPTPTRPANWPKELYYGYPPGEATSSMAIKVCELIPRYVNIKVGMEPVNATDEAVSRLAKGDFDLSGFAGSKILDGLIGGAGFEDVPKDAYRALLLCNSSFVFMIARADSGIKSVADLKGKRLSYGGAQYKAQEDRWRAVMKVAGLDPLKDVFQIPAAGKPATIQGLIEGTFDAGTFSGGIPDAALTEGMKTTPMRVIPLTPAEQAAGAPGYWPTAIPAGVFPGQDKDVPVMTSGRTHVCVKKSLPDDLIYAVTKTVFEHLDEVRAVHVALKEITAENGLDTKLIQAPVHPGAVKYVIEKGLWSANDVKANDALLASIQSKVK